MKLRECPFCGGKPKIKFFNGDPAIKKYEVGCNQTLCPCRPRTRTFTIVDDAVAAWNRRVGDDLMERMEDDGK